jgi:hypothetical protein
MDAEVVSAIIAWLVPVAFIVGVIGAIAWPFLNAKRKNPGMKFDWNYTKWQIFFGVVFFIPTIIGTLTLKQSEAWASQGWLGIIAALVAGFGAARGGREAQKTKNPV